MSTCKKERPRVYPSTRGFSIQCLNCKKWMIVPSEEKYTELREHILEVPFFCETGREWRPDLSCDDPADITPGGSIRWAIDKPNIPLPPPGWRRVVKFRARGKRFADVYYAAPLGKKLLRSLREVASFLDEHPEYVNQGVDLSQFSFKAPKPLRDISVLQRPAVAAPTEGYSNSPGSSVGTRLSKKKRRRSNGYEARGLGLETHVPKKRRSRLNAYAVRGFSLETHVPKKKRSSLNGGTAPLRKKGTPSKRVCNTDVADGAPQMQVYRRRAK